MMKTLSFDIAVLLILFVSISVGQTGRWVPHAVPSGPIPVSFLYACGDGCLGYARNGSPLVLFYDINVKHWIEADLGSPQQYTLMVAKGNVVFAYSDTFLIAYSAMTGTWDSVRIEGTPLAYSASPYRPYGCGERLAVFATDAALYVFDAELGIWQKDAYGYPSDAVLVTALDARDDYAELVIARTGSVYQHTAYSRITKNFNQIDSYASIMRGAHGYVGMGQYLANGSEFLGYSAAFNTFSRFLFADLSSSLVYVTWGTENMTSWGVDIDTYIDIGTRRSNQYCFDTRSGLWTLDSITYHYDPNSGTEISSPRQGDHYVRFASYTFPPEYTEGVYVWSGETAQYTQLPYVLNPRPTPSVSFDGSTIFMEGDSTSVLAWDVLNGRGSQTSLTHTTAGNCFIGENYCSFSEWNTGSDSMVTHFYDRSTNGWSSIVVPQLSILSGVTATDVAFGIPFYVANPFALLYSSVMNTITTVTFNPGDMVSVGYGGVFALASTSNRAVLFDATAGSLSDASVNGNHVRMGDSVAIYYEDNNVIHGYSVLSRKWTTATMNNPLYLAMANGFLGIISTIKVVGNYEFYAFNGFHDCWVELPYSAGSTAYDLGERTALVVRADSMYAFDPEITVTGVRDKSGPQPAAFSLDQNYPNPFNPSTVIRYALPVRAAVSLMVYDVLGREIGTLVDAIRERGEYRLQWNASRLSSGIYFYTMNATSLSAPKKNFSQIRKMIFVK